MTMKRRKFLSNNAAGVGLSQLGAGRALAAAGPLGSAQTTPFAVGVGQYNWTRGRHKCTTYVYYPSTGTAGGNPVTNAPVANGAFRRFRQPHDHADRIGEDLVGETGYRSTPLIWA